MEDGLRKERQKVALRRQKGALQHPKQNKKHFTRTERQMAKWKKTNTLTRRNPRKVVKTTTESLRTDSLVKEDLSKVPKRSAHNKKQSY